MLLLYFNSDIIIFEQTNPVILKMHKQIPNYLSSPKNINWHHNFGVQIGQTFDINHQMLIHKQSCNKQSMKQQQIIKHKVLLLQNATNRLMQQHQTLLRLSDSEFQTNVFHKLQTFMGNVQKIGQKLSSLKTKLFEEPKAIHRSTNSKTNSRVKESRKKIGSLRLKIKKRKNQLVQNKKYKQKNITKLESYLLQEKLKQIQQFHTNLNHIVDTSLKKYQNKLHKTIQQRIINSLKQNEIKYSCNNIERDLGIIMCQFYYLQNIDNQKSISQPIQSKYNNLLQTGEKKQQSIMKKTIQIQRVENELKLFVKEGISRMNYCTSILDSKILILKDCLQAHKNSLRLHKNHSCYHHYDHVHNSLKDSKNKKIQLSGGLGFDKLKDIHSDKNSLQNYNSKIIQIEATLKKLQIQNDGLILYRYLLAQKLYGLKKKFQVLRTHLPSGHLRCFNLKKQLNFTLNQQIQTVVTHFQELKKSYNQIQDDQK